jgi:mannobiose 2-epimerase
MPKEILDELKQALVEGILPRWYPLVVDHECGGYFTNVTCEWTLPPAQEKMIVTQARHVWTTSKVAQFLGDAGLYLPIARHGYEYLRDVMWDDRYGGFYQTRDRCGGISDCRGWREEKRTYGNAFAVYGLAALYGQTNDPGVLDLARRAFHWIEEHAYDPRYGGYFEFLTREGEPFDGNSAYKTIAADANELGYKDQNSSIHLLEAYTELYRVWKDPLLGQRLADLLSLIRDRMVHERGYLQLFFQPDWTPVSFRDAPEEIRRENYGLDHVSFGHDYETSFLMLEASHTLGIENDAKTLLVSKKMLDHALANGWERGVGGFFDAGYYFNGKGRCTIIEETKNWWAQAEALNALLLFSRIYPESEYRSYFLKQWEYVKKYVIDHERGDWFEGGIDRQPQFETGPRSHIWKCTYHTSRALMNCIALLSYAHSPAWGEGFDRARREITEFVAHWNHIASQPAGGGP